MTVVFVAAVMTLVASGCTGASPQPRVGPGHEPGEVFRDCATCPEMVVVPSGTVLLGTLDWGAFPGTHRSAWRGAPSGGTRNSAIGFRVARSLDPAS